MPSKPSGARSNAVNTLAAIDEWIRANNAARPRRAAKVRMDADLERARAAIASLIAREKKQRAVLEALCATYLQNRHAIGAATNDHFVEPYVACITLGGVRCSDTSTGRLWLRADALARADLRLLGLVPEWRSRIGEMAAHCPVWAALAEAWDELTDLMLEEVGLDGTKNAGMAPRTHARVRAIRRPLEHSL